MHTLHVSRDFEADAATIFDVVADHAGYASLPGVREAWLRTPGETERGGVGAERVIVLPAMRFVERITEYKPGETLGYRIIKCPLPIEHIGARIMLQPLGTAANRTRVHWTSRLRGTTPVGADLTAAVFAAQMRLAYRGALAVWARRLGG
ncbi:SRPBCC family protein [Salinisphaera sp.]|uniref:SRPBCC family protein n=1 Tax=Salinisphaera sp. TaxID=1914330 RepID=UPI002D791757|nr:SRPBCC family protein [Salinisphaera sp.]HET7313491.1 SRPBCC family protein [Salinisphaera sp.]